MGKIRGRTLPSLRALLLIALASTGALFAGWAVRFERRRSRREPPEGAPEVPPKRDAALVGVGFVTDFLDTLGVGSFATTTSLYKLGGTR